MLFPLASALIDSEVRQINRNPYYLTRPQAEAQETLKTCPVALDATIRPMKRIALSLIVAATLLGTASAQTVINGVVISHPGQKPVTTPVHVAVPVTPTTTVPANGKRTVPAFVDDAVPADWVDIRGRISLGHGRTSLPSGSKVSVNLVNTSRLTSPLVSAKFGARVLPASYQVVASPRHFTDAGHYAVQAVVASASGKILYKSALYTINPAAKRILADIQLH